MPEFSFSYQLTRADLAEYRKAAAKRTATASRRMPGAAGRIGSMLLLWLLICAATAATIYFAKVSDDQILTLLLGFTLGTLVSLIGVGRMSARLANAAIHNDGPTLSPHKAHIDSNRLIFEAPHAKATYEWPLFMTATEQASTIILWLDPGHGLVIPMRAFKSVNEAKTFLAFAHTEIAAAALKGQALRPVA